MIYHFFPELWSRTHCITTKSKSSKIPFVLKSRCNNPILPKRNCSCDTFDHIYSHQKVKLFSPLLHFYWKQILISRAPKFYVNTTYLLYILYFYSRTFKLIQKEIKDLYLGQTTVVSIKNLKFIHWFSEKDSVHPSFINYYISKSG